MFIFKPVCPYRVQLDFIIIFKKFRLNSCKIHNFLVSNNSTTTPATFIGWFSSQSLGYVDPIQPACLQPPSSKTCAEDLVKQVVELYQDETCFIVHNNVYMLSLPESKSVFSQKSNIHVVPFRRDPKSINKV